MSQMHPSLKNELSQVLPTIKNPRPTGESGSSRMPKRPLYADFWGLPGDSELEWGQR